MSGHTPDGERFLSVARHCDDCGALYDESYCPVCEEFAVEKEQQWRAREREYALRKKAHNQRLHDGGISRM